MGQPSFYHATVALSFQIEICNLDSTKSSFLATSLYKKVIFTKNWVTMSCRPSDDIQINSQFWELHVLMLKVQLKFLLGVTSGTDFHGKIFVSFHYYRICQDDLQQLEWHFPHLLHCCSSFICSSFPPLHLPSGLRWLSKMARASNPQGCPMSSRTITKIEKSRFLSKDFGW